ncbi:hypothetical protein GMD78_13580 [Ornithinibacillus sp. L9]|uniref:Uncharacterized protein n=1 Tax=Ornithinibacillus caprae TaxID=2678566 RepID=A0A6N8FLZ0_9BACI|nr:hypothetical protein [Ornithinibacillus caprae]MUK89394.1 hypothetical protein [Ornithinibacillus caprae]
MMSLVNVNLGNVVKKQYLFKLRSYVGVFTSLVVLQLIALLFSLGGTGGGGGGSGNFHVMINYYSGDVVIIFTILWVFINGILITTKAYREDDFSFVTNRLTNNLSNILFLLTASLVGGVTAIASGILLKVIRYFFFNAEPIITTFSISTIEIIYGVLATILYVFLFGSLGYLVGSLVQLYKKLAIILPVAFFGILFALASRDIMLVEGVGEFYFKETSFLLFTVKVITTSGILLIVSLTISNRQEVRL